jgi:hypothetical protein
LAYAIFYGWTPSYTVSPTLFSVFCLHLSTHFTSSNNSSLIFPLLHPVPIHVAKIPHVSLS